MTYFVKVMRQPGNVCTAQDALRRGWGQGFRTKELLEAGTCPAQAGPRPGPLPQKIQVPRRRPASPHLPRRLRGAPSLLCQHELAGGPRGGGLGSPLLEAGAGLFRVRQRRASGRPRGGGSGGGAETEAFPGGERSEAPRERLQGAPRLAASLPRPPPQPLSGLPAPRRRPRPHCSPSPTRAAARHCQTGGPCRPEPAGSGALEARPLAVGMKGHPGPPSRAQPRPLFSSLGTSYRPFSARYVPRRA